MRRVNMFLFAAIAVAALSVHAFAQNGAGSTRMQPTATIAAPKIITLDNKGMAARTATAEETSRVAPKPAPPSPQLLMLAFKSLGLKGTPQPGEYVTLTSSTPLVAERGYITARHVTIETGIGSMRCTSSTVVCDVTYHIKPAAAGQSYLVDITIRTMQPNTQFNVENGLTKVTFEQTGDQHILLTFTASDTGWQGISISSDKAADWITWSCKVTLIK